MSARIASANDLLGHGLETSDGRDLGEVRDVIIDVSDGTVAYIVLARGGILGVGEKLFAIPWDLCEVTSDGTILLDVEPTAFDDAVGFDPDHWPRFDDEHWRRDMNARHGIARPVEHERAEEGDHGRLPEDGTG